MKKVILGIVIAFVVLIFIGIIASGGESIAEDHVKKEMEKMEDQVAADFVEQYNIAVRNGSAMDAYAAAGMCAAAFLQAKDETNYQKWKKIEAEHGKAIGL